MPRLPGLSAAERTALDEFLAMARQELGHDLKAVWLFGSRAPRRV